MTCSNCSHWKSGSMNEHGFGACAYGPSYTYLPMGGTCPKHQATTAAEQKKRQAYILKKGIK
jgi:hypothetical protein